MAPNPKHVTLIKELSSELNPVFEKSDQAIYLYLDDEHKICNKKFARLLGYKSVDEWVANQYPVSDVVEKDQQKVINAYISASRKLHASQVSVTLTKKDGAELPVNVIMVPVSYKNLISVLHFINPIKKGLPKAGKASRRGVII